MRKLTDNQKDFVWKVFVEDIVGKWKGEYKKEHPYESEPTLQECLRISDDLYEFAKILVKIDVINQEQLDMIS